MKICKKCKEPKFNFQMKKFYYVWMFNEIKDTLSICKKCASDIGWSAVYDENKRLNKNDTTK